MSDAFGCAFGEVCRRPTVQPEYGYRLFIRFSRKRFDGLERLGGGESVRSVLTAFFGAHTFLPAPVPHCTSAHPAHVHLMS